MSALGAVAVTRSVQDAQCPPPEKVPLLGGSPHSLSVACSFPVFWSLPGVEFAIAQGQPMTYHTRHWLETADSVEYH